MGGRIIALGLVGWSGIIALAWWLADQRIELCGYGEHGCIVRATAARDFVVVFGLSVALVVIVAAAFVWVRRGGSISFNWPRKRQATAIVDAKPRATSTGKGFAFAFAKAIFPLALALIALLGVALYQKPAPAPAWAAAPVVTPVEENPYADLIPVQPDTPAVEENYDAAADRLEALEDIEYLPTKREPGSSRLPNRNYSIGTGAAPNRPPAPKLEGPEYTMNVDETLTTENSVGE